MRILKFLLFAGLLQFVCMSGTAQDSSLYQTINKKLSAHRQFNSATELYLHLDKSIYVHNENIWFSAYLLRSGVNVTEHHTVFVLLSRKDTKQIVLQQKFVMENGLASGYLFLPDTLSATFYNLIAYTNQLPNDPLQAVFHQEIRLASSSPDPYQIRYSEEDLSVKSSSLTFQISNLNQSIPEKPTVKYKLLSDKKIVSEGFAKLDLNNKFSILSSTYREIENTNTELITEIKLAETTIVKSFPFVINPNLLNINWYPEGGDLINGLTSQVTFEVKRSDGSPVAEYFLLLDGQQRVDSIKTNKNGIGVFELKPILGHVYSLHPANKNLAIGKQEVPNIKNSGYSLHIKEGVLKDTLHLTIRCGSNNFKTRILIHDYYREIFFEEYFVRSNQLHLKIPVSELSPGRLTVTLFDSLGKPTAERAIFVKPETGRITIQADSITYHQRSKVTLRIKSSNPDGTPIQSLFSFAVVLHTRIDTTRFQDIVPFYHFNAPPYNKIVKGFPHDLGADDQIEAYLISKGWTKNGWHTFNNRTASIETDRSTKFLGQVTYKKGRLSKPQQLSILSGSRISLLTTDNTGRFELAPDMITSNADERPYIIIEGVSNTEDYNVAMIDSDIDLRKRLAYQNYPALVGSKPILTAEREVIDNISKTLTAVVVKSKARADKYLVGTNEYHSPNCQDYVCMFNILNCKNHPFAPQKPIEGHIYDFMSAGNEMIKVVYKSCSAGEPNYFRVDGRYYSKEFNKADYKKFNPVFPETSSTVLWVSQVITDKNGEAAISFYTNDLTGKFSCILEGMTDKGVISGKMKFSVIQ